MPVNNAGRLNLLLAGAVTGAPVDLVARDPEERELYAQLEREVRDAKAKGITFHVPSD